MNRYAEQLAQLERERRLGRIAGGFGLGAVLAMLGALMFANAHSQPAQIVDPLRGQTTDPRVDRLHELVSFHAGAADQAAAVALRCLGLLLTIGVGLYLYSVVRARRPQTGRWQHRAAIAGPLLVAGATIFGFFALHGVADVFYASGPRTAARASQLIDRDALLRTASVLDIGSRVVFAGWVALASLEAMRANLLTNFLGYWGIGACGALIILPVGDAMFIGWLASMAILALGYWPGGGRPAGWATIRGAQTAAGAI